MRNYAANYADTYINGIPRLKIDTSHSNIEAQLKLICLNGLDFLFVVPSRRCGWLYICEGGSQILQHPATWNSNMDLDNFFDFHFCGLRHFRMRMT